MRHIIFSLVLVLITILMISAPSNATAEEAGRLPRSLALRLVKSDCDSRVGGKIWGEFKRSEEGVVTVRSNFDLLGEWTSPQVLDPLDPLRDRWQHVQARIPERHLAFRNYFYGYYMGLRCLAVKGFVSKFAARLRASAYRDQSDRSIVITGIGPS